MASLVRLEDTPEGEVLAQLEGFTRELLYDQVLAMMRQRDEETPRATYPLQIDYHLLVGYSQDVGALVLFYPSELLVLFNRAITNVQRAILTLVQESPELNADEFKLRTNFVVRIHALPSNPPFTVSILPRASDVNKLIAFKGTVIRTGHPKELEAKRHYRCTKCLFEFDKEADLTVNEDPFPMPTTCPSGLIPACSNKKFALLEPVNKAFRDFQEIKVQEHVHVMGIGSMPRAMQVFLLDDLVDAVKPGDDVTITGIVLRRWGAFFHDERCDVQMILIANHISVNNEQKFGARVTDEQKRDFDAFWERHKDDRGLEGRNKIVSSICPDLYGMFAVKLALSLVLAGGVQRVDNSGTRVRGESHFLLVGDPGLGKSQVLKYAAKIASRSVLTTGIGSTTAGLTVTVVKEKGGDYALEAGALVLADGGVCCIDEFNSMRKEDKAAIHEAMEQQTLSVAKGGMVTKLQSRCSVIAAVNPRGKYDEDEEITTNINIASPLLSRFDLVLLMLDRVDRDWDLMVSDFILRSQQGSASKSTRRNVMWSIDTLQSYFCHIRSKFKPSISDGAKTIIVEYYKKQRASDQRHSARTTVRLLESLIRLSQAHAKIMYRDSVTVQDAVMAVILTESSLASSALLSGANSNTVRSMPPENPEAEYREQESSILRSLNLRDLIPNYPAPPPEPRNDDDSGETNRGGNESETSQNPTPSQIRNIINDVTGGGGAAPSTPTSSNANRQPIAPQPSQSQHSLYSQMNHPHRQSGEMPPILMRRQSAVNEDLEEEHGNKKAPAQVDAMDIDGDDGNEKDKEESQPTIIPSSSVISSQPTPRGGSLLKRKRDEESPLISQAPAPPALQTHQAPSQQSADVPNKASAPSPNTPTMRPLPVTQSLASVSKSSTTTPKASVSTQPRPPNPTAVGARSGAYVLQPLSSQELHELEDLDLGELDMPLPTFKKPSSSVASTSSLRPPPIPAATSTQNRGTDNDEGPQHKRARLDAPSSSSLPQPPPVRAPPKLPPSRLDGPTEVSGQEGEDDEDELLPSDLAVQPDLGQHSTDLEISRFF